MNGRMHINRERTAWELNLGTDGLRTEGKGWRVIKKLTIQTKENGQRMEIFKRIHETIKNYISLHKLKCPIGQMV